MLHEARFKRERHKELAFDTVKIDFLRFGDQVYVHEIKKSRKFEEAHVWQLKYYIYYLQCRGINCSAGVIHYPTSMRKVNVEFGAEDGARLAQALEEIREVLKRPDPPPKGTKKVCARCAYFDFCFA